MIFNENQWSVILLERLEILRKCVLSIQQSLIVVNSGVSQNNYENMAHLKSRKAHVRGIEKKGFIFLKGNVAQITAVSSLHV